MDKHQHVRAATELLNTGGEAQLRYAALELRLAIEAIAYEKLHLYAPRLPDSVLEKWQPPQAFKALEEFEPSSTRNFRLRIAEEKEYGVPGTDWQDMGEHRAFELKWLRKTYNKLGGLVHHRAPGYASNRQLSSITDAAALKGSLLAILNEVQYVADSTIDGSLATVIELNCLACGALIVRNLDGALASHRADCLQATCRAQHHLTFDEAGSCAMQLIATVFDCMKCKSAIVIENRKLDIGVEFKCAGCGARHIIASRQWGYGETGE